MTETNQHVHGDNCNHDQEAPNQVQAPVPAPKQRHKKEDKRFIKVMKKQGLKVVDNITRVTLRTSKNFVMVIENPVIMTSGDSGSNYVIFGEPNFLDLKKTLATQAVEEIKKDEKKEEIKEVKEEEAEEEGDVEQGDIPEESITSLINYVNCDRNAAIKALKKTKGDIVEAITLLS